LLKLKHEDQDIRSYAAETIGMMKDPRAIKPLIEALNDEAKKVRSDVHTAIFRIGAPAVDPLIEALNDEDKEYRAAVIAVLGRIGTPAAVDTLISVVENKHSDIRVDAAQILCSLDDPKAEKYIYDVVVKKCDLQIVAGIYNDLIAEGKKEYISPLINALHQYGDESMAVSCLISENANLYIAASKWARKHGKDISTTLIKGSYITWGSRR
jgi:HEAT repeat protein